MSHLQPGSQLGRGLKGLLMIETAKATGMSELAVKVGVHRGLKALAALIGLKGAMHGRMLLRW